MAYAYPGDGGVDYFPCRYEGSKIVFRGPHRSLEKGYCAMLGGTETYGKFVAEPFPALVERITGVPVINLGCVNAGPDVFLNEPALPGILAGAEVTVLQVMGAQNLTNRFYAVHPRRNDRFLRAAEPLVSMYPEVDFTEFHFTRHLLRGLRRTGPTRFKVLAEELRSVWLQRMTELIARLPGRVVLLWLSDRAPPSPAAAMDHLGDPVLVDAEMVARLRPLVNDYVEVAIGPEADGHADMSFAPLDRLAAAEVPGPTAHGQIASVLAPHLARRRKP